MKGAQLKSPVAWTSVFVSGFLAGSLVNCPAPSITLITLTPVADTMLSENYPDHNFGAMLFVNSGTTQNHTRNRALFQFDPATALPAGAKIQSATLILEVVGEPGEPPASGRFNLHRVLQPWGEGSAGNMPGGGVGQGSPATTNEVTWTDRFAFTPNTWTQPGAAPTNDYVALPSSGVTVFGADQSPYTIPSTPQMVADLQFWHAHPEANFGWLLVCEQESTPFTARRFGAREDPNNAPRLEVEYVVMPLIDSAQKNGDEFTLSFLAQPGLIYTVEYCDNLVTNVWQPLAYVWTPAEARRFQVTDASDAPQRYYRLVTPP